MIRNVKYKWDESFLQMKILIVLRNIGPYHNSRFESLIKLKIKLLYLRQDQNLKNIYGVHQIIINMMYINFLFLYLLRKIFQIKK